jgi:hypothetical protein
MMAAGRLVASSLPALRIRADHADNGGRMDLKSSQQQGDWECDG